MPEKPKSNKTLLVFYLLVFYVMAQFMWWTYLIYDLNQENFEQQRVIVQLEERQFENPLLQEEQMRQRSNKRIWMIAGEGAVFLILLGLGAYYTQRSFSREQAVAQQQRNFLLSVTHELNTPLASIKLYLQTLLIRKMDEERQQEILTNAVSETDRLKGLVDNVLLATRMETSGYQFQRELMNLSDFIEKYRQSPLFTTLTSHRLQWEFPPNIQWKMDEMALTSVLNNLIENAVKYSPSDTDVTISVQAQNGQVILRVADQGQGIAPEEHEKIFQKFYRSGDEDTRNTKGTGLGLFIIQYAVSGLGGRIEVKANTPKGSIFEAIFPQT